MPNSSVFPCMSLVTSPWRSEGVSPSKSVCRPFKRNCLGFPKLQAFLSLNSCWFLQPDHMGTSLPGTGTLGWGAWCGAGTLCSSGRTPTAKIPLPIFIGHRWVWGQFVEHLHPSYQSQCGFFNSIVVGIPFTLMPDSYERWLFCNLVGILTWLWKKMSTVFTYAAILIGSSLLNHITEWDSKSS